MVRLLSSAERQAVAQAVKEAGRRTSAEIVMVVSPASDRYQSYVLLYGLLLGSAIDLGLWGWKITDFPLLLAIQFGVMALLPLVPRLRHVCLRLVPRHALRHRAAHRAYEEYLTVTRHVSADTPIVLFYASLAERYVHILPSRSVREKLADSTWDAVVREFSHTAAQQPLSAACTQAVARMSALLIPHFPAR